jgi:glutaredoxin
MDLQEYIEPSLIYFTVYSKSNCIYCTKVKNLLTDYNIHYLEINCDNYINNSNSKIDFLIFIKTITNKDYRTFPIVFDNGLFIGGYTDTLKHLAKKFVKFNEDC